MLVAVVEVAGSVPERAVDLVVLDELSEVNHLLRYHVVILCDALVIKHDKGKDFVLLKEVLLRYKVRGTRQ